MDTILALKEDGKINKEIIKQLTTILKKNIEEKIEILKTSNNKNEITKARHDLKGYFANNKIQDLLTPGQTIQEIRNNIPILIQSITKELQKL